jgi:hypothetical protein
MRETNYFLERGIIMETKKIFLDLETIDISINGENYRFPIEAAIHNPAKPELDYHVFILLPQGSKIVKIYDENLFAEIMAKKKNEKVTVKIFNEVLNNFIKEGFIVHGWNIKSFDIPLLQKLGLPEIPETQIKDCLLSLRKFRKDNPKKLKRLENNKASTVFKFLSRTDLEETHRAASDNLLECFNWRELTRRYPEIKAL